MLVRPRLALCLLSLSLFGCGGGSSSFSPPSGTTSTSTSGNTSGSASGSTSTTSRTAPVSVFVTDSPQEAYAHVWTTIHKVEVVASGGQAQTVFSDDDGVTVDLKTLRDSSGGRFVFLADGTLNAAMHTDVRVSIDDTLALTPTGAASGQNFTVTGALPRDSQGHVVLTLHLTTPHDLTASSGLVMDFDLAGFKIEGSTITPLVKEGNSQTLGDGSRHEEHSYRGKISDLSGTAPTQTFKLTTAAGQSFSVTTSSSTVIFNSDKSPNAVLANGEEVEVHGRFEVNAHHLSADTIQIDVHGGEEHHGRVRVAGSPSDINTTLHAFRVSTREVRGFKPTTETVRVTTDDNTVFRGIHGEIITRDEFFTKLPNATTVVVEGTLDASTGFIAAATARLDHLK